MNSLVELVSNVLNLTKLASLTLPGLLSAGVMALLLWPPKPLDVMPVVVNSDISVPPEIKVGPISVGERVRELLRPTLPQPNCSVYEYRMLEKRDFQYAGSYSVSSDDIARAQQFALEEQNSDLSKCISDEERIAETEKHAVVAFQNDLGAVEASRSSAAHTLSAYESIDSPLVAEARGRFESIDGQVQHLRKNILAIDQQIGDREFEISELRRFKAMADDRLSDPGRLRPEKPFDAFVEVLSRHVLAFIILALTLGVIIKAIITSSGIPALYSVIFESVSD